MKHYFFLKKIPKIFFEITLGFKKIRVPSLFFWRYIYCTNFTVKDKLYY